MDRINQYIIAANICFLLFLSSGCASFEGKFTGTKQANIGIFADQTIATLTGAEFGLPTGKSVYVREYITASEPEEQEFTALEKELEVRLLRLVKYSITLVDIAETSKTEAEQVQKYADFLKELQKTAESKLEIDPGYYDDIVEKVRGQDKFYEALQQAQPLLNASGRAYQKVMDKIELSLKTLEAKIDRKIDERFAEVIAYQHALEKEKYAILRALGFLYNTYKGDPDAFQKLRDSNVIRNRALLPKGKPSDEDLAAITEHLVKRLDITHKIWQEIEPDWELYRATHNELDELYREMRQGLNRIRAVIIVWSRAHQKMASGVSNPAEWFDIENAPAQLFQLGTKTLF
jgi:hypothetical protein